MGFALFDDLKNNPTSLPSTMSRFQDAINGPANATAAAEQSAQYANANDQAIYANTSNNLNPYITSGFDATNMMRQMVGMAPLPQSSPGAPNSNTAVMPLTPATKQIIASGNGTQPPPGYNQNGQLIPGRATGGPVHGQTYVVGEQGPELLHMYPGSKGYVEPNPRTKMAMEHGMYPGRASGGSVQGTSVGSGQVNTNLPMNGIAPAALPGFTASPLSTIGATGQNSFGSGFVSPEMMGMRSAGTQINSSYGDPNSNTGSYGYPGRAFGGPVGTLNEVAKPIATSPSAITARPLAVNSPEELAMGNLPGTNIPTHAQAMANQAARANPQDPTLTQAQILKDNPGYQFELTQGLNAIRAGNLSNGSGNGGEEIKGELGYATGLASQDYNNIFNQEATIAGMGESAAGTLGEVGMYTGMSEGSNDLAAGGVAAQGAMAPYNTGMSLVGNVASMFGSYEGAKGQ